MAGSLRDSHAHSSLTGGKPHRAVDQAVTLEQAQVATHTFEDFVTPDELRLLQSDETQQITEMTPPMPAPVDEATMAMQQQQPGMDPSQMQQQQQPEPQQDPDDVVYGVVLTKQSFRNKWHLDPVPPECFFISRGATCVDDARVIGIAQNLEVWEAMQVLGISEEDLVGADRDPELDDEALSTALSLWVFEFSSCANGRA